MAQNRDLDLIGPRPIGQNWPGQTWPNRGRTSAPRPSAFHFMLLQPTIKIMTVMQNKPRSCMFAKTMSRQETASGSLLSVRRRGPSARTTTTQVASQHRRRASCALVWRAPEQQNKPCKAIPSLAQYRDSCLLNEWPTSSSLRVPMPSSLGAMSETSREATLWCLSGCLGPLCLDRTL